MAKITIYNKVKKTKFIKHIEKADDFDIYNKKNNNNLIILKIED